MNHPIRAALVFTVLSLTGCDSAATEACRDARMGVPPGAPPGSPTECASCCQQHGSYQAANNNVESSCECN